MLTILIVDNTFFGNRGKQSSGGSNWINSSEMDNPVCKRKEHGIN
jgi:pyruvate/2-oxoacid:ferredoxin oxidoreductase beta subunit